MNIEAGRAYSQMFILRVWAEEVAPGRVEMRGLVKYVLSGEAIYFRRKTPVYCL